MTDDWDDDHWDDDPGDDQFDEEHAVDACGPCPECGVEIDVEAEMCPACGHWLSTAERHKLWDGGSRQKAALSVAQYVLVIVLTLLFLGSTFRIFW
ncbi:MAG: hypothetical protein ACR2NM_03820 [Bythopirellula sp.]